MRASAVECLLKITQKRCDDHTDDGVIPPDLATKLLSTAETLFRDDDSWPLGITAYYWGHIPDITHLFGFEHPTPHSDKSPPLRTARVIHSLAIDWHLASIRLSGRIWGEVQRSLASRYGF
ncbi:hypothetical protein C0991_002591 [Blastosporella zonata]|nr:hypothetical protein C0991_002591 [Blastosporella zonata]